MRTAFGILGRSFPQSGGISESIRPLCTKEPIRLMLTLLVSWSKMPSKRLQGPGSKPRQ